MEFIESLVADYGAWLGVLAALVLAFDRIAKLTPTKTDDKVLAFIYKVTAILGLKIKDRAE